MYELESLDIPDRGTCYRPTVDTGSANVLPLDADRILCLYSPDASLFLSASLPLSLSTVRPPSALFLSAPVALSSLTSHNCVFIPFCQREAPNTRTTL